MSKLYNCKCNCPQRQQHFNWCSLYVKSTAENDSHYHRCKLADECVIYQWLRASRLFVKCS